MITAVADLLRCPRCSSSFVVVERTLRCEHGHAYDIARQGYVNLTGAAQPAHADTVAMVATRAELLDSGRFDVLTDALVAAMPAEASDLLDVGTGTGHYARAALEQGPSRRCLGLDVSVAACRRAAQAHPRLGVVTADAWQPLPVADAAVDLVLSIFSPRHASEFVRVLRPGGSVITVTPRTDHLVELREALGLLGIQDAKETKLGASLGTVGLTKIDEHRVLDRQPWSIDDAVRAVSMGPNAFHTSPADVRRAAEHLDWPRSVTVSCTLIRWRR